MRKFFRLLGLLIMLIIIFMSLPFVIPKLLGYNIFEVVSASMEPEYPVGSLIYVDDCEFDDIDAGDIISFYRGQDINNIITHRVVMVYKDERCFMTQGDANEQVDPDRVPASRLIGKSVFSIKHLGFIARIFQNTMGRISLILVILIDFMLILLSDYAKSKEEVSEVNVSKNKRKNLLSLAILLIGLIMVFSSSFFIIRQLNDYSSSNNAYMELEDNYLINNDETSKANNSNDTIKWIDVDFDGLCEINPEIIGWIYFENEDISYPIMYSGDDNKYLRTTFEGKSATAGSIFMEGKNQSDFSDLHTVIYGHNMKNLSMFGKLKNYNRDPDYYKDHRYFQIVTKDNVHYRYEIFAYQTVNQESFLYDISFSDKDENYSAFLSKILSSSEMSTDVEVDVNDKIISLSTCSTSGEDNRFVVNAVLCDTK